ncbi:uncharacterized protein V6R79_014853 [Siganus canaliculatus]
MEFFSDIIVSIHEAEYKDRAKLGEVVKVYNPKKKGSCYQVSLNSFGQLQELSDKLATVKHNSVHGTVSLQGQLSAARGRSLDLSATVMTYIQQKCAEELRKIEGNICSIETQPKLSTLPPHDSTVQVTIRPCRDSRYPARLDMVKQRFITFYQRTAADLQIISVSVSSHDSKDLSNRFPQLLFCSNKKKITVIGPFAHIANLNQYLSRNKPDSKRSTTKKEQRESSSNRRTEPSKAEGEDELCPICMEPTVKTEKETLPCKHSFCRQCLKTAFAYKPVCPTCGKVYGALIGTQPDGGKMTVTTSPSSLPGYERYGTIIIQYHIPSGIQKEEHPNPGQPYEGLSRTAYLPDCPQGQRIKQLLQQAFTQRLVFTVGRSNTSGRSNVVTWNDIHHKTSTHGGPTKYGYPDPDYLRRVQDELTVKGIK